MLLTFPRSVSCLLDPLASFRPLLSFDPFAFASCPDRRRNGPLGGACLSQPLDANLAAVFPTRRPSSLVPSADPRLGLLGAPASFQRLDEGMPISEFHGVATSGLLPSALRDRFLLPEIRPVPSIINFSWVPCHHGLGYHCPTFLHFNILELSIKGI